MLWPAPLCEPSMIRGLRPRTEIFSSRSPSISSAAQQERRRKVLAFGVSL
jgi:hypothetical protein